MLIHPWDRATREEWQEVLTRHDFGQLVTAGHVDDYPIVVPTHFIFDGVDTLELHLARPNPAWAAIEADPHVILAIAADWAYIEAAWNKDPEVAREYGVPTSYYTAVQFLGTARIIDDPVEKASLLARQLAHSERPGSDRVPPSVDIESDRRQLPGIRGLQIKVAAVKAKQKYGGNKSPEQQSDIAVQLRQRGAPGDAAARAHLLRRSTR